jgi:hypothetical protein
VFMVAGVMEKGERSSGSSDASAPSSSFSGSSSSRSMAFVVGEIKLRGCFAGRDRMRVG